MGCILKKTNQPTNKGESTQHSEHLISVNSRKNNPTLLSYKAARPPGSGARWELGAAAGPAKPGPAALNGGESFCSELAALAVRFRWFSFYFQASPHNI